MMKLWQYLSLVSPPVPVGVLAAPPELSDDGVLLEAPDATAIDPIEELFEPVNTLDIVELVVIVSNPTDVGS